MNIQLNGVTFGSGGTHRGPTAIQSEPEKVAVVLPAADGTRHLVQRSVKGKWTYEWDGIPETTRATLAGIFALDSTFTHTTIQGDSITCQCEPGDYREQISAILLDALHYRVTLTVREA
jgi:hypothetical protein